MAETTLRAALLLSALLVLLAGQRGRAVGFSVELIHRDSPRSPFHDPALSPHERALAAARRSLASSNSSDGPGGAVSRIVAGSFEYLMSVTVGTPPTHMMAVVDTGSDLVWVNCRNPNISTSRVELDPSRSKSYADLGCSSDACKAFRQATCGSSNSNSSCPYVYGYGDGSTTVGLLSTETFWFGTNGSDAVLFRANNVRFGCSDFSFGSLYRADGVVGLGDSALSLVAQLGAKTDFGGTIFSYCLVPTHASNASSVLKFGASAVVSEPGAATTPLLRAQAPMFYIVALESVAVAGQTVAARKFPVILDSGTTLTYLEPALHQPLVAELQRRITLPPAQSPDPLLHLCYDVRGRRAGDWGVPDVTLTLGGGAAVTLRPENTFAMLQEGTLCLAVVPMSEKQPISILGNVAQQNFHIAYDLDARTVTFAPADCTRSSPSS